MLPGMSEAMEFRSAHWRPLDLSHAKVVAVLAMCEVDETPTANTLPSISMRITQFVKLSDGSLIRLDLDRGFTAARHGAADGEVVSWNRPLGEVVKEVLDLVRADDKDDPEAFPWDEFAQAARRRGVDVDTETLSGLPYEVVLSAEAVSVFVG
jgi:hypothetical protein